MSSQIRIVGARQNNLKNLDLTIATGELVVVTGVSGSGKSSLAFDTLYAEGQRRYVETFSPYARQFLDRMDKPQVDRIEGILPAIAIDQTNPVRSSRSTVGTMTELNDHLKLLFARGARLYCRGCGKQVRRDTPESVFHSLAERAAALGDPRLVVTFPIAVPANFTEDEVRGFLDQQGYTRVHAEEAASAAAPVAKARRGKSAKGAKDGAAPVARRILHVVQDRFRFAAAERERVMEALDTALRMGAGHLAVYAMDADGGADQAIWKYSDRLHCADCDIEYTDPLPSSFSFNSPLGACEACRGFGRVIGIDIGLVIPDENKTLLEGAIKPWQTPSFKECQDDMVKYAPRAGIPLSVPWKSMTPEQRGWVLHGDPDWKGGNQAWKTQWYGVHKFFAWLESKAYKMHVRVLLSKYRSYTPCPTCHGARLKPDALLWRLGSRAEADAVLPPGEGRYQRFMPAGTGWSRPQLEALDGLSVHDVMQLPIERVRRFFDGLRFEGVLDAAADLLMTEVRARLKFLCDVGLGYLTLDRQSRTLSGGEVQRINLTTALGTSLVNTLFVLDEPSIGLHPRDMHRVVEVMHRLRDAGNTLVVVEHDPQVMVAADRIIDIGPGPGERGGRIVFDGSPAQLRAANTLTGDYLGGRQRVEAPRPMPVANNTPRLILEGATAHNLNNVSIELPLGRLVCVTGVSGSGKSTLVQDVLYPALLKQKGKPSEAPGAFDRLLGAEQIADVVMVDQTPIGKTARSNPASYVGAFDAIRKLYAQAALSKERGYTAGTFSFNSGDGRCPTCGGTGFEHVEMQFLSDVYLRCPDCDGKRFRPEVLEVRVEHLGKSASIDQVLEMTVSEALEFFKGLRDVQTGLAPLADVGLEYVRLGQPVPTLSGGEAQRLKLAGHLAEAARSGISTAKVAKKGSLFLFDEPTTGLHFDDVARLMRAFRKLLAAGHTLLVIEHNLDVIRAADWLIDLGPEGGDAGGEVVGVGTPQDLMANARSHTGLALRDYEGSILPVAPVGALAEPAAAYGEEAGTPLQSLMRRRRQAAQSIEIRNAREHNLKNVNVEIPRDKFTVITGVSGSGKSTLAFDILFNEGQRRYLESLNAYARAIVQPAGKPDVDAIFGIPPTVAIEQRTSRGGRKSTVATMTEIHHFLRLLYVKLGTQYCPDCKVAVEPQNADQIVARLLREHKGQHIGVLAPLVTARKGYYTDLAKWAGSKGHTHLRVDGAFIPVSPWPRLDRYKEHTIELPVADVVVDPGNEAALRDAVRQALEHGQGVLSVVYPLDRLRAGLDGDLQQQHFSVKRACPSCGISFPEPDPRLFSYNSKHGWCGGCFGTGLQLQGFDAEQTGEETAWNAWYEGEARTCTVCHGQRLNRVALAVRWRDRSIAELAALPVSDAHTFFTGLVTRGREGEIARDILAEIRGRLNFMQEVGLSYLALDRAAPTLSGGEAQRIRLAAQLGSNLQGVCYVLDEPTIGLHPRDNRILLDALARLEGNGNTLVVVEHDDDTIRRASHIIDIGPGAGIRGGRVVAQGSAQDLIDAPESVTGRYLAKPLAHPLNGRRAVTADTPMIRVHGARLHNLRSVDASIPIGRLSVVTGVSGSGKSTLAREVLLDNLVQAVSQGKAPGWSGCERITGWEVIDRVLEVDQTPIGKTPRSCPATYVGFWDDVRKQFADTREARMRGWTAARFSFNTGDGRCPICEGQGMRTIEMSFLPDVKVPCDACNGARFSSDTLSVQMRGKNAGELLAMEVDDAIGYFAAHPKIHRPLQLMQDVGLGYLTLGQPSPTLSGGEAQRIKLVTELSKARLTEGVITTGRASRAPHTLYVLDEPTVGLSMADVEKLIHVLHRLVEAGNTVVVIEHNLDVIAEADWLLDLGPEGGSGGGQLVAEGSPEHVVSLRERSHTGRVLSEFLQQ
ncbi:excinuclease ABC, A subunit [Bordetella bronchiseptica MBORD675]|uniref:excinuclease ABC subunit UvrA n=1 Tax=Bordetella bronchiseptica TaxID=518 RepID=UPI00028B2367|nr:excinuclease ABC subunit UvrA [Bordetella bronchiseptica]AUL16919.1 excinuclease ABC subunit A [Bordetella bronchiseptica]AWP60148.1 excinuclease ABC subunit A [Bordetella bronchiseptica]KAK71949.1 excinuclease ABC, A subunit [Bordetella bronchiseptica CA90 BB02]KCV56598.1 excinuclease ABC, A subunit [Bordetella bronchiseptica 7E71]KDC27381.1 excinuclease ABC, A subunit [Bordetella bronchiseptica F4563]